MNYIQNINQFPKKSSKAIIALCWNFAKIVKILRFFKFYYFLLFISKILQTESHLHLFEEKGLLDEQLLFLRLRTSGGAEDTLSVQEIHLQVYQLDKGFC